MASGTETTVEIGGCRVLLRRGGAGAPVLYLHGASGLPGWLPFLDALSESYDVIAPDHPSFGRSEVPDWLEDMNDMAYFYLDFLDAMALDGVHLVGQSLGGWMALEMAVRSTRRLASLTLVGSAGIRIEGAPAADIFNMDAQELTRTLFVDEALVAEMASYRPTAEEDEIRVRNMAATARLGRQPRLFNPGLRNWLHRIDVPTHIVWGAQDRIFAPQYAEEFRTLIAGSSVTMIENCGHLPHLERTGTFVEAVAGFIGTQAA